MLGGVCAGVARSAGLDPLLLRIAVVAVTVLTGGAGLLAYLAAWVLIPREDAPPAAPQLSAGATPPVGVRTAWSAVGRDLKSLAGDLRRPSAPSEPGRRVPTARAPVPRLPPTPRNPGRRRPDRNRHATCRRLAGGPPAGPPPGAVPAQRSPLEAADDAATALGERLRAPEVQEGARRAAASVSQALAASVDEVGRRVRRDHS